MKHACIQAKALFTGFLCLVTYGSILAQSSGTPTYYTANGKTYDNVSPLWSSENKSQWIFGPGLFSTNGVNGTPAKAGKIGAIYFHAGSFFTTNATFSDFTIKLAQNVGTATSFSSTAWTTGMTTVFYKSTLNLSNSFASNWVKIPLQSHFKYDPSKSLVFEMSLSSGQGCAVKIVVTSNKDRIYGTYTGSAGSSTQSALINFGFDIVPTPLNDAAVSGLEAPFNFCPGTYDIKVNIANSGAKKLDSVRINWSIDGTLQSPIYHKTAIDTQGSSNGNTTVVKLDSISLSKGAKKVFKVWTSHPNGAVDSTNDNDTLIFTLAPSLKGNYTIGAAGADYSSVSAAAADLTNYGICGPVSFLIDSGKYTGQVILGKIAGTSSTNTILFRGAKRSNTIIEFDADSFDDWQTVLLHGANYVTIKNLTIKCLDKKYGVAVHLMASSNNTIDSCDLILSNTSLEMWLFGVLGSGALESIVSGNSGDNNTFSNLTITGGYYGIYYSGPASWSLNWGNRFLNNTIKDFYREGIHLLALGNTTIDGNKISSQRWTNNVGAWLSALSDFRFTRNNIYVVYWGIHMDFANYYYYSKNYSLVSNNMVVTTGSQRAALEYIESRKVRFIHNSFLANTVLSVYMGGPTGSDSTVMRNNIIASHSKAVLFAAGNMKFDTLDHNIYYAPYSTSSAVISWQGSIYSSIQAWFSSVTSVNKNSLIRDPKFISGTDLHLQKGTNFIGGNVGVTDDIDKKIRCILSPTIGAAEMSKNIEADTSKPVKACEGDTLKYILVPPKTLTNSSYGSSWSVDSVSIQTATGTATKNFSVIYPSSSGSGSVLFYPKSADVDSAYFLRVITKVSSAQGCDSSYANYINVQKKPKADFSTDTNQVCLGNSITFTNKSTASADAKYIWDMGNGDDFIIGGITYTYENPGKYTVTLKVISGNGCEDITTREVEVHDLPKVNFSSTVQCAGMPVVFSDSTTAQGNISSRLWKFGDGSTDTARNPQHIFTNAGTYQVKLEAVTAMGCIDSITRTVVIPEKTTADFSFSAACENKPLAFTNLSKSPSGTALTYRWEFGDGSTSTMENLSHVYDTAGAYKVKLIASSSNGCSDTMVKAVTVYPNPEIILSAPSGNTCAGKEVIFAESTTPPGTDYYWDFGDGNSSIDKTGKHIYDEAGNFDVWLKIITAQGCEDSVSTSIEVFETPDAEFTADTVCLGDETRFANISNADSGAAFSWDFGDGKSSTDKEPVHAYGIAKSYTVKLSVTNVASGCSDVEAQTVVVHPVPPAAFTIKDISERQKQFTPADSNQLSYLWYFGDGDSSVQVSPMHTYGATPKKYPVRLIVTNAKGCAQEYTDTAIVGSTGIREDAGDKYNLAIFPNPFSQSAYLHFDLEKTSIVTIDLIDALGRKLATLDNGSKRNGSCRYEISSEKYGLSPGPYYLRIQIDDTQVSRVIILNKISP